MIEIRYICLTINSLKKSYPLINFTLNFITYYLDQKIKKVYKNGKLHNGCSVSYDCIFGINTK